MSHDAPTLALLGGSFDPPHVGHLLAATYALAVTDAERLLVLPVHQHPTGKQPVASFTQRMQMCHLAFANLRRCEVSDLESQRPGPSYTVDSVQLLRRRFQQHRIAVVIGQDNARELDRWHGAEKLWSWAQAVVVGRGVEDSDQPFFLPDIGSTDIRQRMEAGQTVDDWLPAAVLRFCKQQRLYI